MKKTKIVPLGQKHCPKCDKVKKVSEFYTTRSRPDGYFYSCKDCDLSQRKLNKMKV